MKPENLAQVQFKLKRTFDLLKACKTQLRDPKRLAEVNQKLFILNLIIGDPMPVQRGE